MQDGCGEGGLVFDPFAGSGTVAIAAEQTGRQAVMMEIDPHYCDVILSRWEEFTNKEATKEERDAGGKRK